MEDSKEIAERGMKELLALYEEHRQTDDGILTFEVPCRFKLASDQRSSCGCGNEQVYEGELDEVAERLNLKDTFGTLKMRVETGVHVHFRILFQFEHFDRVTGKEAEGYDEVPEITLRVVSKAHGPLGGRRATEATLIPGIRNAAFWQPRGDLGVDPDKFEGTVVIELFGACQNNEFEE